MTRSIRDPRQYTIAQTLRHAASQIPLLQAELARPARALGSEADRRYAGVHTSLYMQALPEHCQPNTQTIRSNTTRSGCQPSLANIETGASPELRRKGRIRVSAFKI